MFTFFFFHKMSTPPSSFLPSFISYLLPSLYIVNPTMLAYIWNFQLSGTFFHFFYQVKEIFFSTKSKKNHLEEGKKVELYTDTYRFIFMFRIPIHRSWCKESNEHYFLTMANDPMKVILETMVFFLYSCRFKKSFVSFDLSETKGPPLFHA